MTRIRRSKHTREFIEKEFKKFGYTLITKVYKNSTQVLEVRCKKGHKWAVCWNNFSRGTRCRHCFMEAQIGSKSLKKIVLRDKFFNISEAARILGVNDDDFRRHISLGLLPGPTRDFGTAKKYYKMPDIEKIETMIE